MTNQSPRDVISTCANLSIDRGQQFVTVPGQLLCDLIEQHDAMVSALVKIANSSVGIEEKNGAFRAWTECAHVARAALKVAGAA